MTQWMEVWNPQVRDKERVPFGMSEPPLDRPLVSIADKENQIRRNHVVAQLGRRIPRNLGIGS